MTTMTNDAERELADICLRHSVKPPRPLHKQTWSYSGSNAPTIDGQGGTLPAVKCDVGNDIDHDTQRGVTVSDLRDAVDGAAVLPPLTAREAEPPQEKTSLSHHSFENHANPLPFGFVGINGLNGLLGKVKTDAIRSIDSRVQFKAREQQVASRLAGLRTEIRGQFLSMVPLLKEGVLSKTDQYWLVGKLRPWNYMEGEDIVAEGEMGDKLYIIERGRCDVFVGGRMVTSIGRKDFFGELAMLHASPRTATVRAVGGGVTVLSLSRDDLFQTISKDQIASLAVLMRTRMFSSIPLLKSLDDAFKERVSTIMRQQSWPPKTVLSRQGHTMSGDSRRMYIVEQGYCEQTIRKDADGEPVVKTLQAGDFFNMISMYYGCLTASTVVVLSHTMTLSISFDELASLCDDEFAAETKNPARIIQQSTSYKLQKSPRIKGTGDSAWEEETHDGESWQRMRHAMLTNLVRFSLFPGVGLHENSGATWIDHILKQAREVRFEKWKILFNKGEFLYYVYILESGNLAEHKKILHHIRDEDEKVKDGDNTCVEHIMPGTILGGYGLEEGRRVRANSTVAASAPSKVIRVPREAIKDVMRGTMGSESEERPRSMFKRGPSVGLDRRATAKDFF